MRTTRGDLDRVQRITVEWGIRSWSEMSLMSLQGGAGVGTPWLLEEDMGRRSPLSEYMSHHLFLTHHRIINPCENKVWEIYFYKEVCLFVHWSSWIMFDYVYAYICICMWVYNTFLIISTAHLSIPNSISISRLYILTARIRVSNSFSFLANSLVSSMYIRWLIFSCNLVSLYLPVYFLIMQLSGIITIINSNGDSASPWNIPF